MAQSAKKSLAVVLIGTIFLALAAPAGERRGQDDDPVIVTDISLNEHGDASVRLTVAPLPPDEQAKIANDANRLLIRALGRRTMANATNIAHAYDPGPAHLDITAQIGGMADSHRGDTNIALENDSTLIHAEGNLLVFVHSRSGPGSRELNGVFVNKFHLPEGATNISFEPGMQLIQYDLPRRPGPGRWNREHLAGHWRLALPPELRGKIRDDFIIVDINPSPGGGYNGSLSMGIDGLANRVEVPITECRLERGQAVIIAASEQRDAKNHLRIDAELRGPLDNNTLDCDVKIVMTLNRKPPTVSDFKLRFVR